MPSADTKARRDAPLQRRHKLLLLFMAVWLAFQVLVPLRHFLYPGYPSWNEEGHRFAWRMKLRDKKARATFDVRDPATGRIWPIDPEDHLSSRQLRKMPSRPDMILQFAHYLRDLWADERGISGVEVRATVWASLNGRPPSLLIDPERDLAGVERSLRHADWIMPLEEPLHRSAE